MEPKQAKSVERPWQGKRKDKWVVCWAWQRRTNNLQSTTMHQETTIANQLPTITHQLPTINYQKAAIENRKSRTSYQRPTIKSQQSTISNPQPTSRHYKTPRLPNLLLFHQVFNLFSNLRLMLQKSFTQNCWIGVKTSPTTLVAYQTGRYIFMAI